MRRASLLLLLELFRLSAGTGWAQARAGCPVRPQTLAAMRGCYRPLVVFALNGADPGFREQEAVLDAAKQDVADRLIVLVPVLGSDLGYQAPLHAPLAELPEAELAGLRRRFARRPEQFRVVLLGEDGGAKLWSSKPLPIDALNETIDRMPTRRQEMQRSGSH